jgi:hypothetical protein
MRGPRELTSTRRVLLAATVAGATAACAWPAVAIAGQLTISPLPGTPDASPITQISFLGVPQSKLGAITVVGSRTGPHAGKLMPYSNNNGASFLPDMPFLPAEHVRVRITARGHVGARDVRFTIGTPGAISGSPPIPRSHAPAIPSPAPQAFVSRPDLKPPVLSVSMRGASPSGSGAAPSDLFVAPTPFPPPGQIPPLPNVLQRGPAIYDTHGNLIWFHPQQDRLTQLDLAVQRYDGSPVLTWWQGQLLVPYPGMGLGIDVIADSSYRQIATVAAGNGYQADIHDFVITPHNTALLPIYSPVLWNLRSVDGEPNSSMLDSIVQEVDIKTGLVMWEWHTLGHVPVPDSDVAPLKDVVYDPTHLNSIELLRRGYLLISERNNNAIYEINRAGKIVFTLGGVRSTFKFGKGARFSWQHDARLRADATLSMFDDHHDQVMPPPKPPSRGLILRLDPRRRTATLVHQYLHHPSIAVGNQGNLQELPNGDRVVGYGPDRHFAEFARDGRMVLDASFQRPFSNYRSLRFRWTATPALPPDAAARHAAGGATVYASWNGATEVAHWQVLAGSSPTSLKPAITAPRAGFETSIAVGSPGPYYAVQALNVAGQVLGTSRAVTFSR